MRKRKDTEYFKKIFAEFDYIMTTAQLNSKNIYYRDIQELSENGLIEKIRRGYYHWLDDDGGSEAVIISKLFPDAVLCMETALFYYGYSDRNPAEWHIAIDKNASRLRTRIDYPFIKAYRTEPDLLYVGETKGEIDFTPVRIYDRDRTMCDVMKNMNKMDREIFNKAVQGYVNDTKKNIPNLMRYAKKLRVQKRVKDMIGVWL